MSTPSGYSNGAYDMTSEPVKQPNGKGNSAVGGESVESGAGDVQTEITGGERATWGGQVEFILTIIGYAVGLGNVWRFPYLCYKNGGGAFLIPYFGMLAIVGIPIFYLELSMGQFASLGPLKIWTLNPMMKGVGYAMVIVNVIICMYYNVIVAWCLYYFFASMTLELPWTYCNNWWNSDFCLESDYLVANCTDQGNDTLKCDDGRELTRDEIKTPSEEYYYDQVLQISSGIEEIGEIRWQLACCLLLAWAAVFFILIKGIASLGKVVYFTSIFPYILLTIMLVRGVTLEGAAYGIEYYLKPDFSRLSDASVWSDAATQIFYSLGACTGGLMAMASYNKFHSNCLRDAIMVPIINCGTSFYAGFVIFSVLGFMATLKGVPMSEVADSGPGLVFVVYPEGLTQMPAPPVWSLLFFFMLISLGMSSQISMVESFFAAFTDEFPIFLNKTPARNLMFRASCITFAYLVTLPMVTNGGFYLFNLIDVMIGGFPLLFVGLFEFAIVNYIYGFNVYSEDVALMLGSKPGPYWKITWIFISPAVLALTISFMAAQYTNPTLFETYEYPVWAISIGWGIVAFPLVFIPGFFLYRLFADGAWEIIKKGNKPTPAWGPALQFNRTGKYAILDKVYSELSRLEDKTVTRRRVSTAKRASSIVSSELAVNYSTVYEHSTQKPAINGYTVDPDTYL